MIVHQQQGDAAGQARFRGAVGVAGRVRHGRRISGPAHDPVREERATPAKEGGPPETQGPAAGTQPLLRSFHRVPVAKLSMGLKVSRPTP
ncbi:hypothetical protein GCM10010840_24660 [Deinococcus aerolatus]|uniref:Uncharacterized protein n=1 Tax=Deinococcus aerolatus TaxID=522487 RepID=A0ABQ2GCL6_9DEIO|nr:hypothetical protein GCM10010840_24660 [Deinococcus aerolatus]